MNVIVIGLTILTAVYLMYSNKQKKATVNSKPEESSSETAESVVDETESKCNTCPISIDCSSENKTVD